ncbi:hypothetical protein [Clostridium sp.]|uniref:hypothetical protein n=1 Tax=Clostridium sp. TaxID=1506 RepID=UPI001A50DED4|nr:hypothetical protein [Clostridium sp.]MBK5239804.1 hypothetical protein [Clostridium sp.]
MMIKVVTNNNPRKEESFFIEDVKDLSILKVGLGDVRDYVRSINKEFDEFCKTGRAINDITYVELAKCHNWVLSSLALQSINRYKNSNNVTKYYDCATQKSDCIYMNNSSKVNLFTFKIPDKSKANKFVQCLLSTVNEDIYVINDKGQTVDSIRHHNL